MARSPTSPASPPPRGPPKSSTPREQAAACLRAPSRKKREMVRWLLRKVLGKPRVVPIPGKPAVLLT